MGAIIKENIERVIELYNSGNSLHTIGKLYNVNNATVRYHLIKNDIPIRNLVESVKDSIKQKDIIVDDFLHENIIGWILGDGSVRICKRGRTPIFTYTDKKKEHIDYIAQILLNYNIKTTVTLNRHNNTYRLQSESLPILHQYYELFYGYEGLNENNQKRKILPNIELTPIILLNWFIGDGSIVKQKKLFTGQISCKYKNDYIISQLENNFGKIGCYKSKTKTSECHTYYFNHQAFTLMLKYIGDCPIDSYKYKWI